MPGAVMAPGSHCHYRAGAIRSGENPKNMRRHHPVKIVGRLGAIESVGQFSAALRLVFSPVAVGSVFSAGMRWPDPSPDKRVGLKGRGPSRNLACADGEI